MNKKLLIVICTVFIFTGCTIETGYKESDSKNASASATLLNLLPEAYIGLPQKKGGLCAFDTPSAEGNNKFISGWAVISAKDGVIAEKILLKVTVNGVDRFLNPSEQKRDDVAKYFNSPMLVDSGFSAYVKKEDLPMNATVSLLQVFEGSLYNCDATLILQ